MVDGGQVGEVLLEVRAELGVGVDLDQLLLAARLLAVKVGHVLLRLGADLGAAAAHVVGAQHVLHHGPEGGGGAGQTVFVHSLLKTIMDYHGLGLQPHPS